MGVGQEASERIWRGMKKKPISDEGKLEGEGLLDYVPTYEEFEETIEKMNPHSTGGVRTDIFYGSKMGGKGD